MITSKPSLRSGFDCIIRPAPSGAGRTTPSQPGHYPLMRACYDIQSCGFETSQDLAVRHLTIYYNTRSTQKGPVRQQNAWFDTKKPGSTQKCPVRHKNALPSMHQLTLPLSNTPPPLLWAIFFLPTGVPHSEVELQTEFKSFTAAHLGSNTNQHTD